MNFISKFVQLMVMSTLLQRPISAPNNSLIFYFDLKVFSCLTMFSISSLKDLLEIDLNCT